MKQGRAGGKSNEIVVFMTRSDPRCDFCSEDLGRGAWIRKVEDKAQCLECADLDHLVFLPRGDAALTRRAGKHSRRVGRSGAAKIFDPQAIDFAVTARVRHAHTRYDDLLVEGLFRDEARAEVRDEIDVVLRKWSRPVD